MVPYIVIQLVPPTFVTRISAADWTTANKERGKGEEGQAGIIGHI